MSSKHSSNDKISEGKEEADLSEWMTHLPEELLCIPLNKLAIPGSHDSGAYWLNKDLPIAPDESACVKFLGSCVKNIVSKWSLTQKLTIAEQLEHGIRYLDMRTAYLEIEKDFFYCHGLYGHRMSDLFGQINTFLNAHPKEIVVIDFNHNYDFTPTLYKRYAKLIESVFAHKLYPIPYAEDGAKDGPNPIFTLSLHDILKDNKQVIAFYPTDELTTGTSNFWPSKFIYSPWFNTASVNILIHCLNLHFGHCHENSFNVFQAILSPQIYTILFNLTNSLENYLVCKCNKAVSQWLKGVSESKTNAVNIVICDFITKDNCIRNIIRLNDLLLSKGKSTNEF